MTNFCAQGYALSTRYIPSVDSVAVCLHRGGVTRSLEKWHTLLPVPFGLTNYMTHVFPNIATARTDVYDVGDKLFGGSGQRCEVHAGPSTLTWTTNTIFECAPQVQLTVQLADITAVLHSTSGPRPSRSAVLTVGDVTLTLTPLVLNAMRGTAEIFAIVPEGADLDKPGSATRDSKSRIMKQDGRKPSKTSDARSSSFDIASINEDEFPAAPPTPIAKPRVQPADFFSVSVALPNGTTMTFLPRGSVVIWPAVPLAGETHRVFRVFLPLS